MIFLMIILLSFFIFLYFLYFIGKEDFVLTRKGISFERVFSMAIITGIVSLFISRLSFVIFSMKLSFLNPIVFFAIFYYHGLSLMGGIVGGSLFLYIYATYKKIQIGRVFDLFTMAFAGVLPIGMLFNILYMRGKESMIQNIIFLSSIIMLFIFAKFIYPYSSKGEIKDGSLGLIFLLMFSFIYFISSLFLDIKNFSFLSPEHLFVLSTFFVSLILIINQEIMNKFLIKK